MKKRHYRLYLLIDHGVEVFERIATRDEGLVWLERRQADERTLGTGGIWLMRRGR